MSGAHDGKGRQLVVCEQSEPHVPAEQITRCSNIRLRELGPKNGEELEYSENGAAGR